MPEDELALLRLYAEYNRSIDAGDGVAWASTWVEDGVFEHPASTFTGRAELEGFIGTRVAGLESQPVWSHQHWNSDLRFKGNQQRVEGHCRLLLSGLERASGKPVVVVTGLYTDILVKMTAQWLFERRTLVLDRASK